MVQTQHPNLLFPQEGMDWSTISGHSLSAVAPRYIVISSVLEYPQGFLYCIKKAHTSSLSQSSIGENTNSFARVGFGLSSSLTLFFSRSVIVLFLLELSFFLVPSTRITCPCSAIVFLIKSFTGRIFSRSVHHLYFFRGNGYPRPIRLTQNVLSYSGIRLTGLKSSPFASAAAFIHSSDFSTHLDTTGDSTKVSVFII